MRIGFYSPTYPIFAEGGIGTYTRSVAQALSRRDHEVHVLTPGDGSHTLRDGAVLVHTIPVRYARVLDRLVPGIGACWRVMRAFQRLARDYRLDIIEFPNWEGVGLYVGRCLTTPLVVRLHTSSLEAHQIDGTLSGRIVRMDVSRERKQGRIADCLVTHSETHRRAMAEEYGVPIGRIALVPHGIAIPEASKGAASEREAATVLYVGRLEHRKGTLSLLDAVPQILREVPDAMFVLIGRDRPHCPGGKSHAEYLRENFPPEIARRVRLLGRLSDEEVEGWYKRAALFVAPSLYESFGLVFLEAMRWATPVIGTTAGGIPEIVENNRSGLLVPPGNSPELAAAVIALLKDERRRHELGVAGRQRVIERFSEERMAQQVEELFVRVLKAA